MKYDLYQNKINPHIIIKACRYKPNQGLEDAFQFKKFLWWTIQQPVVYSTITRKLQIEAVSCNDFIVYEVTPRRIFKGVYPKKIFLKLYKKIKVGGLNNA